jgi:beta-lactamase regulating signal transducer with metallopeptidase domain
MMTITNWSDAWFRWIVAASWQLALLTALVAAVTWLLRRGSPRLRHALWLLVLVKAMLPPSLAAPWGIGEWGVAPAMAELERNGVAWTAISATTPVDAKATEVAIAVERNASAINADGSRLVIDKLLAFWTLGALLLFGVVAMRYWRLRRAIGRMEAVDEGPLRIELERLAIARGSRRVPDLYLSAANGSPFLIGTLRPAIVLPAAMRSWSAEEIRAVLLHELMHWRRRDPWIGWLQAAVQALFWFHPCVWLANRQIRQEREAACDAAVLDGGGVAPQAYGETLLKIVGAARGRSLAEGSLVGVFERGTDLPLRLEAIMNFRNGAARFGWGSWIALAASAMLLLPMATVTNADEKQAAVESSPADKGASGDQAAKPKETKPASKAAKSPYPQYKSNPAHGATNVDPSLKEIVIRFDREMGPGMSITGDPALLPPINQAGKPGWRNAKTFVLPVTLAEGAYYRIGINSKSHQSFQDTFETPALPSVIAFTTKGASKELIAKVATPHVVSTEPKNGAKDVDAGLRELKVTFDLPMGGGMSIIGEMPGVPGERPTWSKDRRTITLPIKLEPGREYRFGLNSLRHVSFQSEAGVPLEPVAFEFSTAAAK